MLSNTDSKIALETGCRQKEIATLERVESNIAYVDGKTGPREVPLSHAAYAAWLIGWLLTLVPFELPRSSSIQPCSVGDSWAWCPEIESAGMQMVQSSLLPIR